MSHATLRADDDEDRLLVNRQVCVVVAAQPESLTRVAGLPLVVRTAVAAQRAGFPHVVVLASESVAIGRALDSHPRTAGGRVAVTDRLDDVRVDALMVVAGDVLVSAETLANAAAAADELAAVMVITPEGAPAVACGPLASLLARRAERGLGVADCAEILRIPRAGGIVVREIEGIRRRIADARDVVEAERALCAQIRAQSAATDGFLARLDRRVSCGISRWLVRRTPFRPNHVTAIGTAIGIGAAMAFARGTYASGVIGAALFVLAAIVDGCDGEVARLTFRESTFGQRFDVTTDNLVHLAIFIGLAVGLHRADPNGDHIVLAAILLSGFALDGALSYYFLVVRPEWRSSAKGGLRWRVLKGLEALMNRDFAYVLLALAVAGRLQWFLWGAAIGSYVFAALFVTVHALGEAD